MKRVLVRRYVRRQTGCLADQHVVPFQITMHQPLSVQLAERLHQSLYEGQFEMTVHLGRRFEQKVPEGDAPIWKHQEGNCIWRGLLGRDGCPGLLTGTELLANSQPGELPPTVTGNNELGGGN